MTEIVSKMTEAYDQEHVARLLPELLAAECLFGTLETWREAAQLGVSEALEKAFVAKMDEAG